MQSAMIQRAHRALPCSSISVRALVEFRDVVRSWVAGETTWLVLHLGWGYPQHELSLRAHCGSTEPESALPRVLGSIFLPRELRMAVTRISARRASARRQGVDAFFFS